MEHEAEPGPLDELVRRAQVIELRPDDVLIISNTGATSPEYVANLRAGLDKVRPGTKVVVFAQDINLDVLRNLAATA